MTYRCETSQHDSLQKSTWITYKKEFGYTFEVIAYWISQSSYYSVILRPTGVKLHHLIAHPKGNWVTQSSYYSVILRPMGLELHHVIAYKKVAE